MTTIRILATLALLLSLHARAGVLVTEASGKAEVEGKGPLATLAELPDGSRLNLPAGARVVVVDLASGREFVLEGKGRFSIAADGPRGADGKTLAARPLKAQGLPPARVAAARVAQATLVMRSTGKGQAALLRGPARTVVLSLRPSLRWEAVDGAERYRVTVQGVDGSPVLEAETAATELAPPADAGLAAGGAYRWRLEALGSDGRTLAEASAGFSVATEAVMARLRDLEPAAGDGFARRVLYAAQLQEAGATEEAARHWKLLAAERPEDPVLQVLAR